MDGYADKSYYLYKIINQINDKFYIGVTNNAQKRWYTHKFIAKSGIEKFPHHFRTVHQAIQKYGVDNFKFEIINIFHNEDQAYNEEIKLIAWCKENDILIYNEAIGGKGTGSGPNHPNFGKKFTEEQRKKMSIARIGYKPTLEARHKMSLAQRGENHPMYGKHHTEEAKEKIRKASTGKEKTEETRNKMSLAAKGKIFTEEHKKKISESKMGSIPWNIGIPRTEETCNKISKTRKEKNYCGEQVGTHKLTLEQVIEIKKLSLEGVPSRKLAKLFGVGKTTILYIRKGKSWAHVNI